MADPRDILTPNEGKRILRIGPGDSTDDTELAVYITAASRAMDQHFGNTVALTVSDEIHDGLNESGRGYRNTIVLDHRPVMSVTSVIEHRAGQPVTISPETTTQQPTEAFHLDRYPPDRSLYNGFVRRRSSGYDYCWEPGRGNIVVTYTAGRVATTTDVDPRFKRACGLVLVNLWRDREPGLEPQGEFEVPRTSFPAFAIPHAAKQLLPEEWGEHQPWGIA